MDLGASSVFEPEAEVLVEFRPACRVCRAVHPLTRGVTSGVCECGEPAAPVQTQRVFGNIAGDFRCF